MKEYGADRLNQMFALRSFIDAGIRPTQASDYPPGPFEPMMALPVRDLPAGDWLYEMKRREMALAGKEVVE